jgi:predicted Rossmann fold flavoprotein
MKKQSYIIVGAGASGMITAITLARKGYDVQVLEQNNRVGKKILVSGNGKCNIANTHISPSRFYSQSSSFVTAVLEGYHFNDIEIFFSSIGLALIEGEEGKVFPLSLQASTVVALLVYEAKALGVEIICNCTVTSVDKKSNFILETSQGRKTTSYLVLASGSPASPQLGGSRVGYGLAQALGHRLIIPQPSLVQLCSEEPWVKEVSGVKVKGIATLYANGEYITEKKGDLLFTKYGISGLAILDISREVSLRLAQYEYCELSLDLMPSLSKEQLIALLLSNIHKNSSKPIALWLQGFFHEKLISIILSQAKSKIDKELQLNRKEINKLVHSIKHLKLSISDTKGFAHAEVSTGGIDTREIDPKTLESKKSKNLFLLGEMLDIDGDRGGFNFHFSWVCGLRLGKIK